jgi:hypothetical protein
MKTELWRGLQSAMLGLAGRFRESRLGRVLPQAPTSSAELRCSHTALLVREADRLALRAKLAPAFLSRLGLSPRNKVLDLQGRARRRTGVPLIKLERVIYLPRWIFCLF